VFYLYPRRKCAVFVHAKTMFSFFALDVKREDINAIGAIFRQRLGKALFDEQYPVMVIKLFNDRMREIRIAVTVDRVVIGTINRLIQDLQFAVEEFPESVNVRNEAFMGAHFRRGVYLAFSGSPLKMMRDILKDCEELKGIEMPEPLSDEAIRAHLGVAAVEL
jgi:hypothetical protein